GVSLRLVGADVNGAADDAVLAALVGFAGGDIDVAAVVARRAAGQQRHGQCGTAVVGEGTEAGIADADLVIVDAVHDAARAARADQVERAGGIERAGDVVGGGTRCVALEVAGDDRV